MVRDNRQGYAIVAVMVVLFLGSVLSMKRVPGHPSRQRPVSVGEPRKAPNNVSASRISNIRICHHLDFHRCGRLVPRLVHQPRRCVTMFVCSSVKSHRGGVGSGLYGMLVLAVITVFICGIDGRSKPEYLRKKIGGREIKSRRCISLRPRYCADGTALAMALPGDRSHAQPWCARLVRSALRFHLRREQKRLGIRGISVNTNWYNTLWASRCSPAISYR